MQLTVPKSVALNVKYAATLEQTLTIGRIPGGEMYSPLKEFGKRQKNLRASRLLLICVTRVYRNKGKKEKRLFIDFTQPHRSV